MHENTGAIFAPAQGDKIHDVARIDRARVALCLHQHELAIEVKAAIDAAVAGVAQVSQDGRTVSQRGIKHKLFQRKRICLAQIRNHARIIKAAYSLEHPRRGPQPAGVPALHAGANAAKP